MHSNSRQNLALMLPSSPYRLSADRPTRIMRDRRGTRAARICRVANLDWQLGRVYFLAFLNPLRRQSVLSPYRRAARSSASRAGSLLPLRRLISSSSSICRSCSRLSRSEIILRAPETAHGMQHQARILSQRRFSSQCSQVDHHPQLPPTGRGRHPRVNIRWCGHARMFQMEHKESVGAGVVTLPV
jgi:hypothetical protein